jgi:hypothetical protein
MKIFINIVDFPLFFVILQSEIEIMKNQPAYTNLPRKHHHVMS